MRAPFLASFMFLASFLLLALTPERATATPAEPRREGAPRGWLGVAALPAKEIPTLPDGLPKYPGALEVVLVYPKSPGESAGISVGDVILALDGVPFDPADGDVAAQFRARLMARAAADRVELLVLHSAVETRVRRDGALLAAPEEVTSDLAAALGALSPGGRLSVEATRDTQLRRVPVTLAAHPDDRPPLRVVPDNGAIHAHLAGRVTPLLRVQERAVAGHGWADDTRDLRARLARIAQTDDGFLRDDVRFVLREPHLVPELAGELLDALAPRGAGPGAALDSRLRAALDSRLRAAAMRDRIELTGVRFAPLPRGVPAKEHLQALVALVAETAALREAAFAGLSPEERSFLAENMGGLIALTDSIYLHQDGNAARRKRNLRVLEIAARVPRRPLYQAALSWARLSEPAWLEALRTDLAREPEASAEFILRQQTPHGEIVIGGSGRNRYRGFEPAIVIDLAGDDIHSNNAGTARWDALPCAAVIDLGGDDAYESTEPFTQGSAFGGVGLLVDTSGDDRHVGGDFTQGAAFLGIAAVLDLAGDDLWHAGRLSQSCAAWGLSLLFDAAGDDVYESPGHGQALGLPGGFAILHDVAGEDRYFAKGGPPTGYGTQGVFDAWAQGCGLGFRQLQSGGIGILADDGGSDDMEAGNFAQGGGYYRGWGLLRAGGRESDSYLGSRYNQGFSAHAALGTFVEEGGNDRYVTRDGVIAGLAWDQCVTYFLDASGDDTYLAGGFSLGASAHNSFAYFIDGAGSDRYHGAVARAGGNDYHGGTSLSLFADLGPGRDVHDGGLSPARIETNGVHGVAFDAPGTLESLAMPRPAALKILPLASPALAASAQPDVTTDAQGNAVLTWIGAGSEGAKALLLSRREAGAWTRPVTVHEGGDLLANWADTPRVGAEASGRLAVSWPRLQGESSEGYDVVVQVSSDAGRTWSAPVTPHRDGSATEHDFPSLHEDPAGGLGIVWLDGRATGGHGAGGASGHGGAGAQMLMAATLAPDGALGPERVIDERVCDCCATASLRAGDSVLVAYRDRGEDEVRDISVVRRLKGEWSPPVTVHADGWKIAGCPVNGPALASGGPAGSPIALAWFTSPESGPSVNVAFSRDGGATFGSPVRVDDGQPMGRVDVAFTPSGVALVSWIERGPEGASFRVRAVQPSGPVTASAIVAAVDAGRAGGFPRLAASGEGVVAAWTSQDGDEMRVKTALLSWEW